MCVCPCTYVSACMKCGAAASMCTLSVYLCVVRGGAHFSSHVCGLVLMNEVQVGQLCTHAHVL